MNYIMFGISSLFFLGFVIWVLTHLTENITTLKRGSRMEKLEHLGINGGIGLSNKQLEILTKKKLKGELFGLGLGIIIVLLIIAISCYRVLELTWGIQF